MKTKLLNWSSLGWDKFQKLSNQIARQELSGLRFEDFLKKGNKQDGIDGISTLLSEKGKYTVIQCKDEDLAPGKVIKAVDEFRNGVFFEKADHFILATTSDMQSESRQKCLIRVRDSLKSENIDFECWDGNFFEERLKYHYTLVAHYFGQNAANEHCLPKRNPPTIFKNFGAEFIPRHINKQDEAQNFSNWYGLSELTLHDLLIQERFDFPKICLIADPYQGKSLLLKQTAYELTQIENPFIPILIELKSYNIRPIEQLLQIQEGAWLSTPLADLVIMIDGLDEVPTDKFTEAVNHINAFAHNYPNLSIIFSCRKIFYFHYQLSSKIEDYFVTYDLACINETETNAYLDKHLGIECEKFKDKVRQLEIESLLSEPFYLTELVYIFQNSQRKLPNSKSEILNLFIKKSISKSSGRKLAQGQEFLHKERIYNKAIHKLSFLLQALSRNAFSQLEMQKLFADSDLEVLQHSSLITVYNNSWSFTSAQFQEFLTARILSKLSFEQVLALVTIGTRFVKVKAKWIKTVTTMLAFFEACDPLLQSYIELIEKDNIELLFETDRSKFDEKVRRTIIKKLIHRTKEKKMRTMNIPESKIGDFIGGDDLSIDYLLEVLEDENTIDLVKVLCYNTLKSAKADSLVRDKLVGLCLKEVQQTKDSYLAASCVKLLIHLKKFDHKISVVLTSKAPISNEHEYRKEVYTYLIAANLAGEFYSYGIDGMKYLVEYNEKINHHGAENSVLTFLLEVRSRKHIQSFLNLTREIEWLNFFERESKNLEKFIFSFFEKCIPIYECENEVSDDVIEYFKSLDLRNILKLGNAFDNFFQLTHTSEKAVTALSEEILGPHGHGYCVILTNETVPLILDQFTKGNYSSHVIWGCFYGLQKSGKPSIADKIKKFYDDLMVAQPQKEDKSYDNHLDLEKQKSDNDILYFKSIEAFRKGLSNMFLSFETETVPVNSLYTEVGDIDVRKQFSSHLLYSLAAKCAGKNQSVTLDKCLAFLSESERYEYFLADYIMRNTSFTEDDIYGSFVKSFYYKELEKASFENCYFNEGEKKLYKRKEVFLTKIFMELEPETDPKYLAQMLWADQDGVNALIKRSEFSSAQPSLTEKIVERIGSLDLLQDAVSQHIDRGIIDDQVFNTHASLCEYLNLDIYRGTILNHMYQSSGYDVGCLARVYLNLGGASLKLIPLLDIYFAHGFGFLDILDHVIDRHPDESEAYLQRFLAEARDEPHKIGAALRLAHLGKIAGIVYLVTLMKDTGKSPFDIQNRFNIKKANTSQVLQEIFDITSYVLEDDYGSFHDSIKSILIEWLLCLADKSEEDLTLVVDFFEIQITRFQQHPNVGYFSWYKERCLERFRESALAFSDIQMIETLFASIETDLVDF